MTYSAASGCRYLTMAAAPAADTFDNDGGWVNVAPGGFTPAGFQPRYWANAQDYPEGIVSNRYSISIRVAIAEGWSYCIPPALLAHIESGYGGFVAKRRSYWGRDVRLNDACEWDREEAYSEWECSAFSAGTYEAPPPPTSDYLLDADPDPSEPESNVQYYLMLEDAHFVEVPVSDD
jgi:hypothetical protein